MNWISVKEKLPKPNEDNTSDWVLVYDRNRGIFIDYYDYDFEEWIQDFGLNITHWAELPEPPQED
jgi:hypothetical protein